MVNHKIAGYERIDLFRISAHANHSAAQSRQVDHGRHTGKVLQDNSAWLERHFNFRWLCCIPVCQVVDIVCRDHEVVNITQAGLQKHADGVRQSFNVPDTVFHQFSQAKVPVIS